ncbi:MAG: tRNA (adenosine(37)-N6)-dimethylallyltransferase MiaA [Rikenellaceae bacterium]|jgi:tRNA dimethylallyltransferase|nr:tRNA (adenosine(37)-N6)-dimethylallyltransferase MiaA [Rikenellaceae bacterium]
MLAHPDKTLVIILGPTGSGKSDLAVRLAQKLDTEIVSVDSRQIYRGMAIGTAQPSTEQQRAVPHHFIASHEIDDAFTCGRYETEAIALLDRLFAVRDVVVAVGGSGLYIDALCNGMDSLPEGDPELRRELMRRLTENGLWSLAEELKRLDPEYYERIDRQNPQRIVRALEVCLQTGRTYSSLRKGTATKRDFDIIKIGMLLPREELYARIDRRVEAMMEAGLDAEARALYPYRQLNALQTVGYRELFDHFDGRRSLESAVELVKRNSRRYAKRQMTWFGRDKAIAWFDPRDPTAIEEHLKIIFRQVND